MDNSILLAGRIVSRPATRTSPAGVPITRFTLEHRSEQTEAGRQREVRCRIEVVAAGTELQGPAAHLPEAAAVKVRGFISSAGYRSGETRLVLHAQDIERLD